MIHVRHLTSSLVLRDNGDGRTLVGPLLPWEVEARVVDRGRLVTEPSSGVPSPALTRPGCPSPPPTRETPAPFPSA
jgi:hypothetical protein